MYLVHDRSFPRGGLVLISTTEGNSSNCGAVVIGRNEGPRLEACLRSLAGQVASIVYVDSGSTDNSLEIARSLDAEIVELDMAMPFTAARARNAGFERLTELQESLSYVQFVDGDCVIDPGWLDWGHAFLKENDDFAMVYGRLHERYPERSVYNRLCDVEWNIPLGEVTTCGGITMIHAGAFSSVGGFRQDLIAGEEPELCVRLCQEGWKIWHQDTEMALHDANITRFGQWWLRNMRTGYAYALGVSLHGGSPQRLWIRQLRSAIFWGLAFPLAVFSGIFVKKYAAAAFLLYPLQIIRVAINRRDLGRFAWSYAGFMFLSKFAEMTGIARFYFDRVTGRRSDIIEYK